MSQFAELTACQIPFKSGLPSFVRGALYGGAGVCALDGVDVKIAASKTAKAVKRVIIFL